MSFKSIFTAAALSVATLSAAYAAPIELITNGDFETGTFAGWATVNNGGTGGCRGNVWEVNTTGHQGCQSNGTSVAAPISGSYGAFNTFDGGAAPYTLTQAITVPGSVLAASLSFLDEFHMAYSGTLRTFSVDFYGADNTTLLGNVFSQQAAFRANQAWTLNTVDVTTLLSSYAGQTVNLRFTEFVPQAYTGPAGFGIDNISLQASVPEPTTIALLGLGLLGFAASRRKSTKK